jgi:peptide/nickel transport system substrate-binding protein
MDDRAIRDLVGAVKRGRLSRRAFVQTMLGLGLTAPFAAQLLAASGVQAQSRPAGAGFTPTRRGGGGPLKVLWWQAPTLLNPHFAVGTKDQDGSRIFYEPLAGFDPEGNLVPILAAEVPTAQNGGVARDGKSVTWRLKPNVAWHDGRPFSADDVVFNWEYAADPATAAVTNGIYAGIERIEKLDAHTVRVAFKQPTPGWADAFCGRRGLIIPKHVFEPFKGGKSREAPANLRPVGTGPYRFVDFRPGDIVRAEINPGYHLPNRPFFDQLEMKGGGDAPSAARAVLQTGEFDFAWNLQVADDILKRLEQGGKGRVVLVNGGAIEHIQCNASDPSKEVDGERASLKTSHPLLSDPAVRQALNLLVDRGAINEQIYGRLGQASANYLNGPPRYRSSNMRWEFSVDKAAQVLEAAGWKRGADGIRVKDGKRLKLLYQTSINAERQKTQQIVKQAAARAGVEVELKSVVASVYFGSDVANPDTFSKFYSDIQMYNNGPDTPDPQSFMSQFTSWEVATKDNKWQGRNITRWRHEEYDRVWRAAAAEMDPVKRAALFVRMNDLVIQHVVVIPVSFRNGASGVATRLGGTDVSAWDSNLWHLPYWHREA